MVRKKGVPSLEAALEEGFSELKAGEENIKINEKVSTIDKEASNPNYGLKINAVESRRKFISKPIKATKKIVDRPIDAKIETIVEDDGNKNIVIQKIVDSPSSKLGDDFDVGW